MTLVKFLAGVLILAAAFGCGSSETVEAAAPDVKAVPTGPRPGIAGAPQPTGGAGGGAAAAKAAIAN